MEENNKIESEENKVDDNGVNNTTEHHSSSHHSSHSHHHSSHSHHHSSHSHHGRHHSSRRKKRNNGKKKSFLERFENWLNAKFSRKTIIIICLLMLLVVAILVGIIYAVETRYRPLPDDYKDDLASSGTSDTAETPVVSNSDALVIPSYWKDMIAEKTDEVKALQTEGGKDCVSFVWASDTHIPDNNTARTNDIGKLMAKMMDNCDIPFALLTGDIGTRSSYDTETELVRKQEQIPVHLAPLWGTDKLLVGLGNHDGCFGDSSCYYAKQLSPAKMWQFYFRNQALDSRKVFSDDGLYFYIDNKAQKTRFIILNSQYGGEYSVDANGCAVNNRFNVSCYGQAQLDWLANEALDMPEGYGAVITSHVPPNITYTVDKVQLIGIINAYCKKTTYSGSYTAGVDGWTNNSVSVDFTDAKGEIIAMFTGHVHQDTVDTTTLACPLITIISAGAQVNAGEIPEREFETDTETSFDVVTINRKTRTIYCTRVGSGRNRTIKY